MRPDAIELLRAASEFLANGALHRLTIEGGQRVTKNELLVMIRNELADQASLSDLRASGGITEFADKRG